MKRWPTDIENVEEVKNEKPVEEEPKPAEKTKKTKK